MTFKSLTFKFLLLVTLAFVFAAVLILVVAGSQLTRIVDNSQNAMYAERVEVIGNELHRTNDLLQKTGLVEAYERDFKNTVIKEFKETYYHGQSPVVYPFILDGEGRVVMHPVLPAGDISLFEWEGTSKLLDGEGGDFIAVYQGTPKWYIYQHFEPWDWAYGFAVPLEVKYHDSRALYRTLALILGGITILALIVLSLFVTRLTRPIVQLTKISSEIADGNLEQEIQFGSRDEVGILAQSFSRMQDAVREKIDDLARNNEKLRQSEDKYRNLVESSGDFVWEVDISGVYTYASSRVKEMLGYTPEEVVGATVFDFMLPEEGQRVKKKFKELVRAGTPIVMLENTNLHKDGHLVILETNGMPRWTQDGVFAGYRGISRDVTEKKQIREMMIQSEKMMSVGGLAAGMAHEINNPLGIMIQAAQNIERRVAENLEVNTKVAEECGTSIDQVHAYLEKRMVLTMVKDIRIAGDRAAKIVSNMLQFSRRSESSRVFSVVTELIDQTIDIAANDYDLKKKYDFRKIKIIRKYPLSLSKVKLVVPEFEQVILNLLKNAAQAMAEADMTGKQPAITIRVSEGEGCVQVAIQDNGPGMDEIVCKRVFEPFFTTKPVGQGTGLGLSVSYMIITNNHKGTMAVESVVGEGSTFTISLPLG